MTFDDKKLETAYQQQLAHLDRDLRLLFLKGCEAALNDHKQEQDAAPHDFEALFNHAGRCVLCNQAPAHPNHDPVQQRQTREEV